MTAMTLLVDQREAQLELAGRGVVVLRFGDAVAGRVGLQSLRRIVLHGDVQVSAALLRACQAAEVGLVLLPGRGPGEAVQLYPAVRHALHLRHAQHCGFADPVQRLRVAQQVVATKIREQQVWLDAHGLGVNLQKFQAAVVAAVDLATLMGVEGAASAAYFRAWSQLWSAPWSFTQRNRRPPRDPVNALLSLGYTLALQYVGHLAVVRGLDAAIGFLHTPRVNRPALALDLLEPVRPWVDHWIWRMLVSQQLLQPEHFTVSSEEGCRLSKEGRSIFYTAWHRDEDKWLRIPARRALAAPLSLLRLMLAAHRRDFDGYGEETLEVA